MLGTGSTTCRLLAVLQVHPARWLTHVELMEAANAMGKAVDWALILLRREGHVTVAGDPRDVRYQRYRLGGNGVGACCAGRACGVGE